MAFAEPPGWYVISLRPQGGHAALRRAAVTQGGGLIALSPWRIELRGDAKTAEDLRAALLATRVIFTSPQAVDAALALQTLVPTQGQYWIAVGSGTAAALRTAGIQSVTSPSRMDSEGLLALPVLGTVDGLRVGLVTAPGGRDFLLPALLQRGADVRRADVYARVPVSLSGAALRRIRALDAPAALALSSGGALRQLCADAPADVLDRLRRWPVVAASARLQQCAQEAGFTDVQVADGPLPEQMIAVMAHRFR